MRVAVAGLGSASVRAHLPALARLAAEGRLTLVGAADPDGDRRAAAVPQLGGRPVFETAEEMLASIRSDVLVVAAEPRSHAGLVTLGARHGQHVVCEKPLTLDRCEQDEVACAYAHRHGLGLVSVHQYRYSPMWRVLARWGRVASRLRMPFELAVRVERDGTDRHAAAPWRADVARSGGMLADHGVHYVAMGWTISEDLELVDVSQTWTSTHRERSLARMRVGSGTLEVEVTGAAAGRRTCVELRVASSVLNWTDDRASLTVGGHVARRWRTGALSDRQHVDALYVPFYREVAANLGSAAWRLRRSAETLTVSTMLLALLEQISLDVAAA